MNSLPFPLPILLRLFVFGLEEAVDPVPLAPRLVGLRDVLAVFGHLRQELLPALNCREKKESGRGHIMRNNHTRSDD